VLDIKVRFEEKDATVRYLPDRVTLAQILKQYENTPFGVSLSGSVVTIARAGPVTLRSWTQRTRVEEKENGPKPIQFIVETIVEQSAGVTTESEFSLADLNAKELAVEGGFEKADVTEKPANQKLVIERLVANIYESVALKPGDSLIQVNFKIKTTDASEKQNEATGKLEVVVRTPRPKPTTGGADSKGVALIDGILDVRLGHLCDERGCVDHFFNSLSAFASLGAVDPRPGLEQPGATIYLRAGQPIDVWTLRETLRDRSIEISGIVPRDLSGYRLYVEIPRWKAADASAVIEQCLNCRDAALEALESSPLVIEPMVSGGGINFTPKQDDVDLVEILDTIADANVAPRAVWLVPAGVAMPQASPPLAIKPDVEPKSGGSPSHPVVEFEFAHECAAGPTVSAMIGKPSWASRTAFEHDKILTARTAIADRKHAALSPLLSEFRSAGRLPQNIRLRGFGDVRINLEFAHICGDIVYSKPPKPRKKPDKAKDDKENTDKEKADEAKKEDAKPDKKPFVPRALHPVASSIGRKAIQAAIESVPWIKDAVFFDYHTKFEFRGGPKKVSVAFQPKGEDVVRLDDMIDALRAAGFPPKSVMVSRRFSGIPFNQPLPGELLLTDNDGKEKPLSSLKQPDRPLALAFVSLKCKRHKKYEADPKFYIHLNEMIDKYKDRVDFVTVAANPDDKFEEVVAFLEKTRLPVPLHDAKGSIRAALNAQETPAPHFYIFDADGLFRHAGDPHDNWEKPDEEKRDDYLVQALDVVLSGKYAENGAAFFNKSLCNCSHPKCKCPKCGCGPSCRCGIKH
jgi:hypothetical protein